MIARRAANAYGESMSMRVFSLGRWAWLLVLCGGLFLPGVARADLFITGIRPPESKGKDPLPETSLYMHTTVAGFIANAYAVGFVMEVHLSKPFTNMVYVETRVENPKDAKAPTIYRTKLAAGSDKIVVRQGPVLALKMKSTITAKVVLFEDETMVKPIDVLEQKVRSHVDTRKPKVDLDPDLVEKK